jgi:hypothetical protein
MRYPSDWQLVSHDSHFVQFTPTNGAHYSLIVKQSTHPKNQRHTTVLGLDTIVNNASKASPETKSFSYFFNAPEKKNYTITYSVPSANNASYLPAIKTMIYSLTYYSSANNSNVPPTTKENALFPILGLFPQAPLYFTPYFSVAIIVVMLVVYPLSPFLIPQQSISIRLYRRLLQFCIISSYQF